MSQCVAESERAWLPAADPPVEDKTFLWLNFSDLCEDACMVLRRYKAAALPLRKAPHGNLSRWFAHLSYAATLSRKASWVRPWYNIRTKLQWESPPAFDVGHLAARLLSRALLVGRLGNVETKAMQRISAGTRPSANLANTAGVYVRDRSNATHVKEVERQFLRIYLDAVASADHMLLVPEQAEESIEFACRFRLPVASWRRGYSIDHFLALLEELSRRQARVLIVSGFPLSVRRQVHNLQRVHPTLNLGGLTIRVLGSPMSHEWNPGGMQHSDWVESLAALQASTEWNASINQVALLGCGAFGMPLASHARTRGMSSIYVGGRLPALFGVAGTHDRSLPSVHARLNEHWIRPLSQEIPQVTDRSPNHEVSLYWR